MELKFMTPTEVWDGFDATQAPLETSTVCTETFDNITCTKYTFTADTTDDGKLKIACDVFFDERWTDTHDAILVLPSFSQRNYKPALQRLVEEGYIACVVDYCGVDEDDSHTSFPADLAFASFPECKQNLDTISNSARNTPWFVWAKAVRRAITFLSSLDIVSDNHIGLIGFGIGAEIGWQVAGMDKRVGAFVAINGGGYRWAMKEPRFTSGNNLSTDEQRAFSSGVGAETYARFITCPTLFISSRSTKYNDIDRAFDILEQVKTPAKQMIIALANGEQITKKAFDTMLDWLKNNFEQGVEQNQPSIHFEEAEGRLYVRLNSWDTTNVKQLYINYGEAQSVNRHWIALDLQQKVGSHEYICEIPVYDVNELIIAYATFEYANNNIMSTKVLGVIPAHINVSVLSADTQQSSRIIYDGNMGLGYFTSSTDDALLDDDNIFLQQGPFGITGISAKEGDLHLCRDSHEQLSKTAILHFDTYSQAQRVLEVSLLVNPDMKKYTAKKYLQEGEFWQKILLENTDFKSDEGRTLTSFENTKVLILKDVNGIVFNNFLWI